MAATFGRGATSEKRGTTTEAALAGTAAAVALGAAVLAGLPPQMGVTLPSLLAPTGIAAGLFGGGVVLRRALVEVGCRVTWRMPGYRPRDAGALPLWLGFSEAGWMEAVSLEALPHLLVGGQTRGGKSSFLRQLLVGLVEWTRPAEARVVIIDCKGGVEFAWLSAAPHVRRVATDEAEAAGLLAEVEGAVEDRLRAMREANVDDCRGVPGLGRVVVVIDELAELQDDDGCQRSLRRIAARGGAAGVHLVLCTQRPDRFALPGAVKANIPATVAFRTRNATNSEILLDQPGAEELPPKGTAIWQWVRTYRIRTPWLSRAQAQVRVAAAIARAATETQQVPALGGVHRARP